MWDFTTHIISQLVRIGGGDLSLGEETEVELIGSTVGENFDKEI